MGFATKFQIIRGMAGSFNLPGRNLSLRNVLAMAAVSDLGHHPAADIVDPEIYLMIDEMVADTSYVDMTFDDMGMTTTLTADSVSAAEDLFDDGLLATLFLLADNVTVSISVGDEVDAINSIEAVSQSRDRWAVRDDWGGREYISVAFFLVMSGGDT